MAVVADALGFGSAAVDTASSVGGIGPVTSTGEMVATSVAAGILLGGFVGGVVAKVVRWDRGRREDAVVDAGYVGGVGMAVAVAIETIVR